MWFGPHRIGWGLGPSSIEGIVTVVGFTVATAAVRQHNRGKNSLEEMALLAAFLLVVFLKGTSPGGPKAYRQFKAMQATARDD